MSTQVTMSGEEYLRLCQAAEPLNTERIRDGMDALFAAAEDLKGAGQQHKAAMAHEAAVNLRDYLGAWASDAG